MPIDLERSLIETEDFLARQLGSRAARQASRRKVERGIAEVLRRVRRSALAFVLLVGALIVYSLAVAPVGVLTWLVALPTFGLAALITLFWPSRRRRQAGAAPVAAERLDVLAGQSEEWLLERCRGLPRAALPALDAILDRLREVQASPATRSSPELEGEARRLIGDHLPRLVDSYLALPPQARSAESENSLRIAESLDIVASELTRLSGEMAGQRGHGFEVNRRFIETRYREP